MGSPSLRASNLASTFLSQYRQKAARSDGRDVVAGTAQLRGWMGERASMLDSRLRRLAFRLGRWGGS